MIGSLSLQSRILVDLKLGVLPIGKPSGFR